MYGRSRVLVKVEPRSTLRALPNIAFILCTRVNKIDDVWKVTRKSKSLPSLNFPVYAWHTLPLFHLRSQILLAFERKITPQWKSTLGKNVRPIRTRKRAGFREIIDNTIETMDNYDFKRIECQSTSFFK